MLLNFLNLRCRLKKSPASFLLLSFGGQIFVIMKRKEKQGWILVILVLMVILAMANKQSLAGAGEQGL